MPNDNVVLTKNKLFNLSTESALLRLGQKPLKLIFEEHAETYCS